MSILLSEPTACALQTLGGRRWSNSASKTHVAEVKQKPMTELLISSSIFNWMRTRPGDLNAQKSTLRDPSSVSMCDFSKYGGKSAEWQQLEVTLPPIPELSPEELQRTTNDTREAASLKAMETLSSKVTTKDYEIPTRDGSAVKARTYRPTSTDTNTGLPIYIHFHGGGFFFGTLDSENATCANIAIDVGVLVVNVNYRHTPQHPYPTPYDDSEDAAGWVFEHATKIGGDQNRIVIGGISAGGALTASLMQTMQRQNLPFKSSVLGQVLMIPLVVYEDCSEPLFRRLKDPAKSSYKENEFAPILPLTRMRMFNGMLHHKPPRADDRRLNPGLAPPKELRDLPPAAFGICGLDPLRDEALLYAKMLHENGVPTDVSIFKGVPHGFRRFGDKLTASKAWDKVMYEGIRWALSQPSVPRKQTHHVYQDSVDAVDEE